MKRCPLALPRNVLSLAGWALAALLSAPGPYGRAAPVNSKVAAAVVTGWLSADPAPLGARLGAAVERVEAFGEDSAGAAYFVVHLAPSGFVIVAGDDRVEPIIGFAAAGAFDPSDTNPLGALVSRDVPARVAKARQLSKASLPKQALQAQAKWRQFGGLEGGPVPAGPAPLGTVDVSDVRVAPLTQTTWDQGTAGNMGSTACYNYYTPPYGDGNKNNYWAGCVATAMAQLMRYYQYPTAGVGTAAFTIYSDGNPLTYYLQGGDSWGGPYVWANMPLAPDNSPPPAQCQAIGALVADAGASVSMSYTAGGSSGSDYDARNQLVGTFQFGNATFGYHSGGSIGSGLTGMINPNLDAKCPVLLGISGSSGGHEVIADGYGYSVSTLYHHLNLGWSGVSTAWYALPTVDTSNGTFTTLQSCVYNVFTNGAGEIISGRVLDQIGRPVVNASVTATRSGGGTYAATTDTNGIYALAGIPSASSYSVTISKANFASVSGSFFTGTSSDWGVTSGNYWGADFTMNMLTSALDHLAWNAVSSPRPLNTPFGVTVAAQNLLNAVAIGFAGPVTLSAFAAGAGSSTTIIGNLSAYSWIYGSEMTLGYAFTPSTNVQVIAVRGYTTDKVSIWTDSGVLVGSQAVSASGSWTEAAMASPVMLSAGTTYLVGAHLPQGMNGYFRNSGWPTTFPNGAVGQNFYYSYGDICPKTIYASPAGALVDLKYQVVFTNPVPVSPTSSGAFVSGIWNGNITVAQAATNVVLKADDGAGHVAFSTPFNVVETVAPLRLLLPQRPASGPFQLTVSGERGQGFEVQASTNLQNWDVVATLTNTTGSTTYTDPATGLQRRFYRAQQFP